MDNSEDLSTQYKRTKLLVKFNKLCQEMNESPDFRLHVSKLYRQSYNPNTTTKNIFQKYFQEHLSANDAQILTEMIKAHLRKSSVRKTINKEVRTKLLKQQNYRCAICNCQIDESVAHLDHIIPWSLVGDELENNYQMLCTNCNLEKGNNVRYELLRQMKLL